MTQYMIIGNGVAGTTAAEHIRKHDEEGGITIVTEEHLPFYNRMRLPEFISGDINERDLFLKKDNWYMEQNIDLKTGTRISGADSKEKHIITEDSQNVGGGSTVTTTTYTWNTVGTTTSGEHGEFAFENLDPGTYELRENVEDPWVLNTGQPTGAPVGPPSSAISPSIPA